MVRVRMVCEYVEDSERRNANPRKALGLVSVCVWCVYGLCMHGLYYLYVVFV